jgi:hypothetical protein
LFYQINGKEMDMACNVHGNEWKGLKFLVGKSARKRPLKKP